MHCIKLIAPKVLILDQERFNRIGSELRSIHTSVILVRPDEHIRGIRVKEWRQVMSSYTGPIDAWKKEPPCLPDDNATVCHIVKNMSS